MEWQRTKGRELLAEASKNKETGEVTNEEASVLIGIERFWFPTKVRERKV